MPDRLNTPNASYEAMFAERGRAYSQAMGRFPMARRREFALVVDAAALAPDETVLDVPAGGGHLRPWLPAGCRYEGHEPCASFGATGHHGGQLLPLPWPDGHGDVVVSLAGVHHLDDRRPLYAEVARVLRPGGRLVLADVHADSPVAAFLDGFVDANGSTGHRGSFLQDADRAHLEAAGLRVRQAGLAPCPWEFASLIELGAFCHALFDLRRTTPARTAEAIEGALGVTTTATGVEMAWELWRVVAERT